MSRIRLIQLGSSCLSKANFQNICSSGFRAPAARGLQVPADPTRRQRPDLLFSRLELELRAHDPAVLDSYVTFLQQAARHLGVTTGKLWEPPRHYQRLSLLKSVHIFAKHKVQYEARTYFRVLELLRLTGSTADTYLEYTQRMLPEGIAMKVSRHARESLPEHLSQRPDQSESDGKSA
ncbi:28S ribosomal protein S10, mitochondrial-like [Amphibalanus amphitrite]|uniref:28S ribosomal protein S10, mitochondrial-like n=1 Tax=Amphibalanus amphitrite TaxID=1232801 RepID=UPI001C9291C1|nr:28S ribosomal protein S10, mitochondrial-like [Amphibalanus amphitrite]XP_043206216.1 28S ribosomal protein S10, mitochondrial-like [Amphibalanus amphitrite]XP_043206217.1 28S ribosomal protein S10, mitochondrial-like [Amphibalanus amphitrite]XP_043206218.1 28S ribosomal protein S10, mitochondrial-like [Amphibalanus amphitrite]XP_043206219.1 28S ribosomal protein S10, mitochondrial-like [Amphibalanus amphitrite]XP_043206220.1 28S ribosomal protein S10, mitochondrial-like [Amphibalanus amphi